MKKNKLIVILNWSLLFALPITLLTVNVETNKTSAKISPKELSTSIMFKTEKSNAIVATNIDEVDNKIEEQEEVKEEVKKVEVTKETPKEEIKEDQKDVVSQPVYEEKSDVLKSYTGKMIFYNANCTGCSGITSTGIDVSDGRLYYYDNNFYIDIDDLTDKEVTILSEFSEVIYGEKRLKLGNLLQKIKD